MSGPRVYTHTRQVPGLPGESADSARMAQIESDIDGLPSPAEITAIETSVDALDTAVDRIDTIHVDVRAHGGIGDGASHPLSERFATLAAAKAVYPHAVALTDQIDWAALQAAVNAVPATALAYGGGNVLVPYGIWRINRTVTIAKDGVRIVGPGGFAAVLQAISGLTGPMFDYAVSSNIIRGCGMERVRIDLAAASNAGGVRFDCPYDNNSMRDVMIHGIGGTGYGVKVENTKSGVMDVGEGFVFDNVMVWGASGFTGKAWDISLLNEAVWLNCKGLTCGTSFHIDSCRGVTFLNCSAATASVGWRIVHTLSGGYSHSITIDTPTVEGVTTTVDADGSSGKNIQKIVVRDPRAEGTAGPINLDYCTLCQLDVSDFPVNEAATCIQTHIVTAYRGGVSAAGTRTTVMEWANGVNAYVSIQPGMEVLGGNVLLEGTWNSAHLVMAGWHFWMGSDGTFRKKAGAPTSALDGSLV